MHRKSLLAAAALCLAGCGGRLALRRDAPGPASRAPASGLKVALVVTTQQARYFKLGVEKPAEKAFEGSPGEDFGRALRTELERLGFELTDDPASAQGTLHADLLEAGQFRGANLLAFKLGLRGRTGKPLAERMIRGTAPAKPGRFPEAVAAAMDSVGRVLEGEGWIAALAGSPPPTRPAPPFPPQPGGAAASAVVLPLDDRVGRSHCNAAAKLALFEADKVRVPFFAAREFEDGVRQVLRERGVRLVESYQDADWLVHSTLIGFRANCIGTPFSHYGKLRVRTRIVDRAGGVLWEGDLDGHAPGRGLFMLEKDLGPAAGRAGSLLGVALAGGAPAPLFSEDELGPAPAASGGGLGFLAGLAGMVPGASGVSSLTQRTSGLRGSLQTGLDLAQAAKTTADAAERAEQLKITVPKAFAARKVAVLPFDNQTTDLVGPVLVRKLLQMQLAAAGFRAEGLEFLDARLQELGISDGGQLPSQGPEALGLKLESDVLLYGELVEFLDRNLGFYASRTVELRARLVDARTGRVLWEGTGRKSNPKVALTGQAAGSSALAGYAGALAEKAMSSPLRPESEDVVRILVRDMAAGLESP